MKKNYKSSAGLAVALCTLGLGLSVASAADQPKLNHQSGTISSVDSAKHEIVVADSFNNKHETFTWNNATKFRQNEKTIAAAQLKSGEHVRLSYRTGTGMPMLEEVVILPATAQTSAPSKTKPNMAK